MKKPQDFRKVAKEIDRKYIDNGVITERVKSTNDCTEHGYSLSKLGSKYALSLIVSLTAVNEKLKAPEECYASVEPFPIPKNIMTQFPDKIRINQKGIRFVQDYITTHPFNQYLYDFAMSMPDDVLVSEVDMPTQEQKAELAKVKPPQDLILEIYKFADFNSIPREKAKIAFYNALFLDQLDEFTNFDERCSAAFGIMIQTFNNHMKGTLEPFSVMIENFKNHKEDILEKTGFSEQVKNMKQGLCAFCKTPVNVADFRDALSHKEFGISGLCQKCQDGVFRR